MRRTALALTLLALALVSPARGGGGVGELALDQGAVTALIAAHLPGPVKIALPSFGPITLKLLPPESVSFEADGIEARLGLVLVEAGVRGGIALRYQPVVDAQKGLLRLKPIRARGDGALAAFPDLAALLPPVEVPRVYDQVALGHASSPTMASVEIQSIEIQKERLVVRFGLKTTPAPAPTKKP